MSERQLASSMRTTAKFGTTTRNLARVARKYGAVKLVCDASYRDVRNALRRRQPPIVEWFSHDEGHYSVIVGLDRTHITLIDPELGEERRIDRKRFLSVWFDYVGSKPKSRSAFFVRRLVLFKPRQRRAK